MLASDYMDAIMQKELPKISVASTQGCTGYIDFIQYTDVNHPVTKGFDFYGRPFFVVRALVSWPNGHSENVFETFFQRYTDSTTWMGCGHGGQNFLETSGGLSIPKAIFLTQLIEKGSIDLTDTNYLIWPTASKIELV